MIPPGLLIMAASVWRLVRHATRNPTSTPGMTAAFGLAIALFFAGLFSPLLGSAAGENFWTTAAVWLPLAAILTAAARIYAARKSTPKTAPGQAASPGSSHQQPPADDPHRSAAPSPP